MSNRSNRILFLDVLRGVAVLMVLCCHTLPINKAVNGYHWWFILKLRLLGWAGVDLFFVLSGFLVGGLLSAEYVKYNQVSVKRFLLRRAFKIYPPFYFLLLCTLGWYLYFGHAIEWRPWVGEISFLQNYVGRVWKHTWSLAVEEHFYLTLALLYACGSRMRLLSRPLIPVCFVTSVLMAVLLYRATYASVTPFNRESHMFATHMRLDSLLFGSLLAYIWNNFEAATKGFVHRWRWSLLIVATACLAPLGFFSYEKWYMHSFGFTVNYLGFGIVLLLGVSTAWQLDSRFVTFACRGIAAIGCYSYSIYLWHMAVYFGVDWLVPATISFEWRFFVHAAVYICGSVLVGVIAARAVEIPALQLRDRLFPGLTTSALRRASICPQAAAGLQ